MQQKSDESGSWWDSGRGWKAFAIAPLAAPLVVVLKFGLSGAPDNVAAFFFPIALAYAYAGTFLFGLPFYLLLRALKLTAFWWAPAVGLVVGSAMALILFLSIGARNLEAITEAIKYGGPPGAAVGALLWLIGRPDRPDAPGEELSLPKWNWNTARMPTGLLVAALASPMIVGLIFAPVIPGTEFSPFLTYPVTLIISVAVFRIMRELNLTKLWIVVVAGCAIGLATLLIFAILSTNPSNTLVAQYGFASVVFVLSGAVVGAIFWLIARPDRHVAGSGHQ